MFLTLKQVMGPKKKLLTKPPALEVDDTDSGEHTSEVELNTDEDSIGSLVDFVVNDDLPLEYELEGKDTVSSDEEVKQVEVVESVVFVDGVRRSTRHRKPVERYVDSDYEELMCEDDDPDVSLESEEAEVEEEDEELEPEPSETSEVSDDSH